MREVGESKPSLRCNDASCCENKNKSDEDFKEEWRGVFDGLWRERDLLCVVNHWGLVLLHFEILLSMGQK